MKTENIVSSTLKVTASEDVNAERDLKLKYEDKNLQKLIDEKEEETKTKKN